MFPMINEGARILEEGIAQRPGDIDVIWVYGYGFPAWRGGPMYYADHGRPALYPRPARRNSPSRPATTKHEPAPLLVKLAERRQGLRIARAGKD